MEVAIIIISVILSIGLIAAIVFLVLKQRSVYKTDDKENKKKEEPKPIVKKEKPVKVELTKEQKEEKKQKEYTSKTKKLSNLGLEKANQFKLEEDSNGVEVVGIIYNEKSKVYLFGPNGNNLNAGDVVVVLDQSNTKRTVPVVVPNKKVSEELIIQPFKDILEVVYQTNEKPALAPVVEEKEEEPVEEVKEEEPVVEETPEEEAPAEEEKPQEEAPVEEQPAEEVKEEPVEEEVVEEKQEESQPEPEPEPEPEVVPEPEPEAEEESEEDEAEEAEAEEAEEEKSDSQPAAGSVSVEYDEATKQYKVIKIKRTYECKLSLLPEDVKELYDTVRNKLLSYKVKYSKTKTSEKFRFNKENIAILKVVGKQVGLYLALDPKELENSKYKGKDLSEKQLYKATPFQYKFKTGRKAVWAVELVEMLAAKLNLEANDKHKDEAYAKTFPTMTEEELIEKGYMTKTETITNEPPKGFHKVEEVK